MMEKPLLNASNKLPLAPTDPEERSRIAQPIMARAIERKIKEAEKAKPSPGNQK